MISQILDQTRVNNMATTGSLLAAAQQPTKKQLYQIAGAEIKAIEKKAKPEFWHYRVLIPGAGNSPATLRWFMMEMYGYPLQIGDYIDCLVEIDYRGTLIGRQLPYVQMPVDSDNIKRGIAAGLDWDNDVARKIYDGLLAAVSSEQEVVSFVAGLAQRWSDTRNSEIIDLLLAFIEGVQPRDLEKFLNWWHQQRNHRRLILLGLTRDEIKDARMTCEKLYVQCMTNPFVVSGLSMEKCEEILKLTKRTATADQRICGGIVRKVRSYLDNRKYLCCPINDVAREFPTLPDHEQLLTDEYGLHFDYEELTPGEPVKVIYLAEIYRMETEVAAWLIKRLRSDPMKTYHPDMTQEYMRPDGKIGRLHSVTFTQANVTKDQRKATFGAINQPVSIITGPAGTGKCLDPETPIRRANQTIVLAKDVQIGDQLFGWSGDRTVLSTTTGSELIYQITPSVGRSFKCNQSHILTVQGLRPRLLERWVVDLTESELGLHYFVTLDEARKFGRVVAPISIQRQQVVAYSIQGRLTYQPFNNRATAEYYLSTLPLDVYDIGLIDYVQLVDQLWITNDVDQLANHYYPMVNFVARWLKVVAESDNEMLVSKLIILETYFGVPITMKPQRLSPSRPIDFFHRELLESLGFSISEDLIEPPSDRINFTVTPLAIGPYAGFELDGDGRFVLGDYTVTHNTTTLKQVIKNCDDLGRPYAICAPYGKAVARIRNVTGKKEATTVCRFVANLKKGKTRKIVHLIIDEASTLTLELFHELIGFCPDLQYITFVGDINQLEPIGIGALLFQMVKSKRVPVYYLSENHRVRTQNGELNGVTANCQFITNRNEDSIFRFKKESNFDTVDGGIKEILNIAFELKRAGIKPAQFVVITPYNWCIPEINKGMQILWNNRPSDTEGSKPHQVKDSRAQVWMVGDKVMFKENNDDIKVYNGEEGIITEVSSTFIMVNFGLSGHHKFLLEPRTPQTGYRARIKRYEYQGHDADEVVDLPGETSELTVESMVLAYGITVDNSQGSEYEFVIFYYPKYKIDKKTGQPVAIKPTSFENLNRSYVAISRTQRACWLVGDIELHEKACQQCPAFRMENLQFRLQKDLPERDIYTIYTCRTPTNEPEVVVLPPNEDPYDGDEDEECPFGDPN